MNLNEMTVKQLLKLATEKRVVGRHKMNKQQLLEALSPKEINTGEDIKRIIKSEEFQETAVKAQAIIRDFDEESKSKGSGGGKKSVKVIHEGEIHRFDKTYQASKWLQQLVGCKYSTVDRYLVNSLKGRGPKLPKALVNTAVSHMFFRYVE